MTACMFVPIVFSLVIQRIALLFINYMAPLWLIGVIMYIFGSISINLGANVVRLSHVRNSRAFFCIGYSFFAVGNLANFAALNLAAQSLLEGSNLISFPPHFLHASISFLQFMTPPLSSQRSVPYSSSRTSRLRA
jgi:hypothetical protein